MHRKVLIGMLVCFVGGTSAEQMHAAKKLLSREQAIEVAQMNQERNEPYVYMTAEVMSMMELLKCLQNSESGCMSDAMEELCDYCAEDIRVCVPARLMFQSIYDIVDSLRLESLALNAQEADNLRSLWHQLCDEEDRSIYVSDADLLAVLPQTRAPRTPQGGGQPPAISQEIIAGVEYVLDNQPTTVDHIVVQGDNLIKGDLYIDHSPRASIFFENSGSSDPAHYDSRIMAFDGSAGTLEQGKLQLNSTVWVDGATDRAGVGIVTPTAKLDVRGASDATAANVVAGTGQVGLVVTGDNGATASTIASGTNQVALQVTGNGTANAVSIPGSGNLTTGHGIAVTADGAGDGVNVTRSGAGAGVEVVHTGAGASVNVAPGAAGTGSGVAVDMSTQTAGGVGIAVTGNDNASAATMLGGEGQSSLAVTTNASGTADAVTIVASNAGGNALQVTGNGVAGVANVPVNVTNGSTVTTETISINATNKVRAAGVVLTSDENMKRNIRKASPKESFDGVMQLNPVNYYWNDSMPTRASSREETGLLAQEVDRVFPNLVCKADDHWGIDLNGVLVHMIGAMQHQKSVVDGVSQEQSLVVEGIAQRQDDDVAMLKRMHHDNMQELNAVHQQDLKKMQMQHEQNVSEMKRSQVEAFEKLMKDQQDIIARQQAVNADLSDQLRIAQSEMKAMKLLYTGQREKLARMDKKIDQSEARVMAATEKANMAANEAGGNMSSVADMKALVIDTTQKANMAAEAARQSAADANARQERVVSLEAQVEKMLKETESLKAQMVQKSQQMMNETQTMNRQTMEHNRQHVEHIEKLMKQADAKAKAAAVAAEKVTQAAAAAAASATEWYLKGKPGAKGQPAQKGAPQQ